MSSRRSTKTQDCVLSVRMPLSIHEGKIHADPPICLGRITIRLDQDLPIFVPITIRDADPLILFRRPIAIPEHNNAYCVI